MNIKFRLTIVFIALLSLSATQAQEKKAYEVACVGFYNLENLFDTIVDPDTNLILQEDFTPIGYKNFNSEKYYQKLGKLSEVISKIGSTSTQGVGAAVLGVCEIENKQVLEDLVKQDAIANRNYQIVHHDSPDHRGIDVGFLYQPKYFTVESSKTYKVTLPDNPKWTTRDQLLVSGKLMGEDFHFIVCHWPSRRGGEKKSSYKREAAAAVSMEIIDSLKRADPKAKIILMGDLNDDPKSKSVKVVMHPKTSPEQTKKKDLYNPMYKLFMNGIGTLAWRDAWNLFDQMIVSGALVDNSKAFETLSFYQAYVYNEDYLTNKDGNFKGYPFRTYVGSTFQGGYSDHFPVYLLLLREKK